MSIKVTVGIVARNEEDYIQKTLESIIAQDFPEDEMEIIVVDGNSTDNTRKLARQTLERSTLQHAVFNETDYGSSGLCFARNLVIKFADPESKFIAYTDADCIVAPDWLYNLYYALKKSDHKIAGAGGPRRVAPTTNKKEKVINHLITSLVAMAGNPAFTVRKIGYIKSIPNYNAIYKKEIIDQYQYDETLGNSDDNELNYRLSKEGYCFKYVPEAKVYHRETNSIATFTRNMFNYGNNITNTLRKHRTLIRSFLPLPLTFLVYIVLLLPLYFLIGNIALIPLLIYIIFMFIVFFEVLLRSKTFYALLVFLLLPLMHLGYAMGVLYNFSNR